MIKTFSKSLSWLLSVVMIFGMLVVDLGTITANSMTTNQFNERLNELRQKYPTGYVWKDGYRGKYELTGEELTWVQCKGFAHLMGYEVFGTDPGTWQVDYNFNHLEPGDIIQFGDPYVDYGNHSVFCISVSGNTYHFVDCNGRGNNDENGYYVRGLRKVLWDDVGYISSGKYSSIEFKYLIKSPMHIIDPVTWESMTVGGKYYLKNNGTGTYMSIDSGEDVQGKNISVYQKTGSTGQQFEIRSSDTDKSYFLRPVLCESSGRVVNVYSDYSNSGVNITIYDYTGHSTQQWKFKKVDGGYAICSANNTNVCIAESNGNVQLATYTGAANQIWTLEPASYADIGTNFYAYIINTAPWKMAAVVGDSEYNVALESETAYSNQFWYFERQDDLFYKITNVKTNQCLDDADFGTSGGTNIGICGSNNSTAQRWALIESNGGYELHPQCAISMAMDVCGASTEDGANIQLWETNHCSAQIFTIYKYGNLPDKPALAKNKDMYSKGDSVTFSWNPCRFAHYYQVNVLHNGSTLQSFTTGSLSYTLSSLGTGLYDIKVTACNQNGSSETAYMSFVVPDYSASYVTRASFNGHTYEYYNQKMDWNQAYKFCEKKGGHLVTITSQEENDFIANFVKNQSENVWTGGKTIDFKTWFWVTGEKFNYQNWSTNQPDYYNNEEDSMEIYVINGTLGKWNDIPQTNITQCGFICEYETPDASKYTPAYKENYNGHEYWFFENGVDWQTAKKICEAKGGYLAIPNNAEENAFIQSGIKKTSKEEAWIGITDIAKEGVWKNVKGGSVTYSNWADDEPSNYLGIEDYVEMYLSGKWNDLRGFGANYRSVGFVCEFDDLCTASGHKYEEKVIPPTETEKGYTLHTCSVCGYSYQSDITEPLGPSDPNAPSIVVGQKSAVPGQTVTVNISMKNNPGITGFKINLSYDKNVLTLQNAETIGFDAMYSQNMTAMPFVVSWESGLQDVKLDGEIIRLTFAVNGNAADGSYPVTVSYQPDDIYNLKEENIHFAVINGSVEVQKHIAGDINNDGKVNMKDVTRLHQYINGWDVTVVESAADVNGDGKVNMKDLTRLHQYINGWDVVIY